MNRKPHVVGLWGSALLMLITFSPAAADVFEVNERLGRGINIGNALEAPAEGEWGHPIEDWYFDTIKDAGFDSVRIPIRWSAHTAEEAPYNIDPAFLDRVQQVVDQALARDLAVVINVHHYNEFVEQPDAQLPRLQAIWRQVGEHFRDYPDTLVFEMLNEPHPPIEREQWNELIPHVLEPMREHNPTRAIIIGPTTWNNVRGLPMELPADDPNLIVTVHYYEPYKFTHQGAEWSGQEAQEWLGTTWTGTDEEKAAVTKDLETAAAFAAEHNLPLYIGEFGAYRTGDMDSRIAWTTYVVQEAERLGASWSYWEFREGFGAYDPDAKQWREGLYGALMGAGD